MRSCVKLSLLLFMISLIPAWRKAYASTLADQPELQSKYQREFIAKVQPLLAQEKGLTEEQATLKLLHSPTISSEIRYLLQRNYILDLFYKLRNQEALELCQKYPAKPDDYRLKVACIYQSSLSLNARAVAIEEILSQAIANHDGSIVVSVVARFLINIYYLLNDIQAARRVYEIALEKTPAHAPIAQLNLRKNMAEIYTSGFNRRELVEEGVKLYDSIEDAYRQADDDLWISILYEKAHVKYMVLNDVDGAFQDFQKIPKSPYRNQWLLAQVYLAILKPHSPEARSAMQILHPLSENDQTLLGAERNYALCYLQLAKKLNGKAFEPELCLVQRPDVPAEEVEHIVKLGLAHFPASFWGNFGLIFWQHYLTQLKPRIQYQVQRNIEAMDLARAHFENKLKDIELKNYQKLKILFVFCLVIIALNFIFIYRLKVQKKAIQDLQNYIHTSVLSRFLPPHLVSSIIEGRSQLESKPHEQVVTILFADLVQFTSRSAELSPEATGLVLQVFMKGVTEIIYQHQGTVDKFIGDAVMVLFGAPLAESPHLQADSAVKCAIKMRDIMGELSKKMPGECPYSFEVRIGIHQGLSVVGAFGDEKRLDYTAIGQTVNIASRIERLAQAQSIYISSTVAQHLDGIDLESLGFQNLKGIPDALEIFAVKCNRNS